MPSVSQKQHDYFRFKLNSDKSTDAEKKVAKDFLDADKAAGKYQKSTKKKSDSKDSHHSDVVAIIKHDGRILVLYHAKKGQWVLPKGHIKEKEDAIDALKEVVKNKLDIEVGKSKALAANDIDDLEDVHVYTVSSFTGDVSNKQAKTFREFRFVSKQELLNFNRLKMTDKVTAAIIEHKLI